MEDDVPAMEEGESGASRTVRAHRARRAAEELTVAAVHAGERSSRNARFWRRDDECDRCVAAGAHRWLCRPRPVDENVPQWPRGLRANNYAGRNIHNGVREHAMAAVNNGIAYHGGLLPFSATFFNFVDYLKPALRLTALAHLHHIYVFTHDSVFLGEDGPTHEPIEQLAMLRAIPNLNTIRPADAIEVEEAWKLVIEPKSGPWALVLTRQKVPFLGARSAPVEKGAYVIADANGSPDLVLIATGSEVSLALETKKLLDAQGINTRVVSMPCWTLFAKQPQSY